MNPALCPLCTQHDLESLLNTAVISAKIGKQDVSEVVAYRCREYGHIFFIRESDLRGTRRASTPTGHDGPAIRQAVPPVVMPCPVCRSTGAVHGNTCATCSGRGELRVSTHLSLRCPVC